MRHNLLLVLGLLALGGCPAQRPADDDDSADDDDATADDDDTTPGDGLTLLITTRESDNRIVLIDPETGATYDGAQLSVNSNTVSTVFTRTGTLFRTNGTNLSTIDPCTGQVTGIALFDGGVYIPGMATDSAAGLYGLNIDGGTLVRIDPATAVTTEIGTTGVTWGNTGLTWDPWRQAFLAIDAATDRLYEIDGSTGLATFLADLDHDFNSLGIEVDPNNGDLYACGGGDVVVIDPSTGTTTQIVAGFGTCNDLAATWFDVACLSALLPAP